MNTTLSRLLAITALAGCASLQAQTVYRCGNSYSQTPCPGGNAIDATDSRTEEQRKAHEASVKQDKNTGDALEKTRLKEEAADRKAAEKAAKAQQTADRAAQKAAQKEKAEAEKKKKEKVPVYRNTAKTGTTSKGTDTRK